MENCNSNMLVYFALRQVGQTLPPPYYSRNETAIRMKFRNGDIEIPGEYGGYIVSCGCGSGKTTNIADYITANYKKGVLYCVDTKVELDKMEQRLLNNGIEPSEILKVHGEVDKDIITKYQKQPELVVSVPILLITHCRLFMDVINLFLLYKPIAEVTGFNGDFKSLMAREDLRKMIILDETPLMFRPFIKIRHSLLGYFDVKQKEKAERNYRLYIKDTKDDPFKNTTKLTAYKRDLFFNVIPMYLPKWKSLDRGKDLEIHFYTSHLIQEGMQCHVLVFEGAGDILLQTSRLFKLIDIKDKYNTTVTFEKIDVELKRKDPKPLLEPIIEQLAGIITSRPGKVLVVVWKNIGKEIDDEKSGESKFRDDIRNFLFDAGCPKDKYEVTYFGSSNTKSTNEFMDYTGMILLGDWGISNDKVKQINEAYMSSTSPANQKLWYFVQLICRIAIRKHNGGDIKVWHTPDYSEKFIRRLDTYLNKNQLTDNENLTGTWVDKMNELKMKDNIQSQIKKLDSIDPNIGDSILSGRPYEIRFTLDRLYELFPKSVKKKRQYRFLVNNLSELGIKLIIE